MRRGEVKTRLVHGRRGRIADGAVRIGEIAVALIQLVDRAADRGIVAAESLQFGA